MPLLLLDQLQKTFRSPDGSPRPVISVPRFALEEREQVALRGASGVGKTTLLNLIAGIQQADAGRIVFDGEEVTALTEAARDRWRARKIGVVFQTFHLLHGYTALENVELAMMFGLGRDRSKATELLHRVGLGDRLRDRPRHLSVGQQQRVAVARALANRPRLVLADEPTSHLDPDSAREALSLLREICLERGAALLLVGHDPICWEGIPRVEEFSQVNGAFAQWTDAQRDPFLSGRGRRHDAGTGQGR